MRVSARGGKAEVLTTPDAAAGERTHRWPTYLPGDAAVLFTVGMLEGPGNYDDARIAAWEPATRKSGSFTRAAAWPVTPPRATSSFCAPKGSSPSRSTRAAARRPASRGPQ